VQCAYAWARREGTSRAGGITAHILIRALDGREWAAASRRSLYPGVKSTQYLSTKTMGGP